MDAVVGHAYDDIVYRNKEIFLQHPEWLYPQPAKGTIPGNPKFDLTNRALIDFVVSDVDKRLEEGQKKGKPIKMITMSPSDGGGTCNSPACQQLGTITDRVYSLVNTVAKDVRLKFPGTWVSAMSYSEYAAPPTIKLEPNTFVSVATAFNYSKFTTDQLLTEWSRKAGKTGIYDYLGLYVWDFDLPGQGIGSRVNQIAENIKKYHRLGARGYDAESTPGSINKGLGHYIVSRLLWDINSNTEGLKKEFFEKCFGRSAPLISGLWMEWEKYPYSKVRESDLANWIDIVDEAGRLETNADVKRRLVHVKVYLHYLYLYGKYTDTKAETELVNLLAYCYNTFDWAASSGYPALHEIGNTSPIPGFKFNDPQAKYKKTDQRFNDERYINQIVDADRKTLQKKEKMKEFIFPLKFQKAIVPAIFNEKRFRGYLGTTAFTGPHYFLFEIKTPGDKNFIDLAGGFVTGGGSDKPIIISVFSYKGKVEISDKSLLEFDYKLKLDSQRFSLKKLPKGYYIMKVDDPAKYFVIGFSPSILYSLIATPQNRLRAYTKYMSFYVPKGTTKFRVFKQIEAILVSPTGREVEFSKKGEAEIDVDVQSGEEGIWLIKFSNGKLHFEGIPPFMCMNPEQMLIPK